MGKVFKILSFFICVILLSGCASKRPMRPPMINYTQSDSIKNYTYFYIIPTAAVTGSSGVYGNQYGVYGGYTKTTNPADIISGTLFKNGFIRVDAVSPENADKTMIISYGETGRRNVNLGYSIEVTIQFVNAKTQLPIVICTAEGQGSTEADDVRIAINRALEPLFKTE
ncbi:MAG: hypothetical protein J6R27_06280 [Muribaculaceae bacterium]|nr:hypothetical protein [Muribaculaceae bacterium]